MKTALTSLLIFTIYMCSSQTAPDKDIAILKREIQGTWTSVIKDTTGSYSTDYYTLKHTFTAKKYTLTINCNNNTIKTKTIKYYFKRTYIEEIGKDIITLVFEGNKRIASYDYVFSCKDKHLKDYYFADWGNIAINGRILSFCFNTNKLNESSLLMKE